MSLYGRFFAAGYDRLMAATEEAGLADRRRALLGRARGRVLELGAGTGVNLAHYPPGLEQLVLSDPEAPMLSRLRDRVAAAGGNATVVHAAAERLPFEDASFDTVVTTLTLCTVSDPAAALDEIRRVLAPGGRLLFIEHVRSGERRIARRQDLLHPLWRRVAHGCHCNRPTLASIEAAGLVAEDVEHGRLPKTPKFVEPMIAGSALKSS